MLDDSLRQRLEALNRGPLATEAALPAGPTWRVIGGAPARVAQHTVHPPAKASSSPASSSTAHPCQPVPGLLCRGEVVENDVGQHLRVRLSLDEFWPGGERLVTARQEYLKGLLATAHQAIEPRVVMEADFAALVAALPDRVLLLDLETCGLAGAALFLVGLLRRIDGTSAIELLMARTYAEEAAVLQSLWQIVAAHDVLMTFNGKSFDWPMVRERSVRHRLQPEEWAPPTSVKRQPSNQPSKLVGGAHPTHVDILHHARRRWRGQLPDCRLQTLERLVCRRSRTGDIAGHRIPAVYAEFVRTGFERDMDAVLHHNALDLVTLLDLALRLAA